MTNPVQLVEHKVGEVTYAIDHGLKKIFKRVPVLPHEASRFTEPTKLVETNGDYDAFVKDLPKPVPGTPVVPLVPGVSVLPTNPPAPKVVEVVDVPEHLSATPAATPLAVPPKTQAGVPNKP